MFCAHESREHFCSRNSWNCSRNEFSRVLTKRVFTKRVFCLCSRNEFSRNEFFALLTKRVFTKRVFVLCSRNEFSRNEFSALLTKRVFTKRVSTKRVFGAAHETSFHETSFRIVSKSGREQYRYLLKLKMAFGFLLFTLPFEIWILSAAKIRQISNDNSFN